jgi:beta-1,4-N-acetylglucosaminyltransferase
MKGNYSSLLIVYGSGGHEEQARRLYNIFKKEVENVCVICDEHAKPIMDDTLFVPEFRDKYSLFKTIINVIRLPFYILKLFQFIKVNKVDLLITPGPGCCILPSFIFRLLGGKVIYLESWSRFYKLSLSGLMMKYIATDFWIQNEELKMVLPNATWVGRL